MVYWSWDTKPQSPIKALRKKYPDEEWKAERCGFGWTYTNNKGDQAWSVAALAPRYDGDDDNFRSEFWIYRKNGIPEKLWE